MESPIGRVNFKGGKGLAVETPDEEDRRTNILVFPQVNPLMEKAYALHIRHLDIIKKHREGGYYG